MENRVTVRMTNRKERVTMKYKCSTGEVVEGYPAYLRTKHWKDFRRKILGLDRRKRKKSCSNCRSKYRLQVHHITYENVGNEKPEDVAILCGKCHQLHHDLLDRGLTSDVVMRKPNGGPKIIEVKCKLM